MSSFSIRAEEKIKQPKVSPLPKFYIFNAMSYI